uniref:Uncharacterized protein n=1 Tax=Arundo donax TaxID=35708 RepID=A0A0A8Y617_ARUDO
MAAVAAPPDRPHGSEVQVAAAC